MAIDNNDLVYLLDPVFQIESLAGKPVIGGHIEVFYAGTDLKYITYQNFDHTENPFKIPLNSDGRAVILVEPQYTYDVYVRDSFNNLICSRLNVKPQIGGGNISIKGRTYHGVEPVVVNNQYNLISARNIPLGVQEPLHFVEDSESACVIGVSGLQPSGDYVLRPELSSYATEDWVNSQSYMHEYMASAFYPMESNPSGYLTEHQSLSGYMKTDKLETADGKITGYDGTAFAGGGSVDPSEFIPWSASGNFATSGDLNDKLDTTAFSTVSGDFITAIPDTYASKDFVLSSVSSKLDSTAFSTVSGDFITALPQGLLNESGFEYDGDKISAYNGSAFVGQGGGGITGEYELSAGNGISIDNYPIEQKTVISVTGNYATEQWVQDQGYLTAETDWTDTITAASANAYNEATAAIPAPFDPSYISAQVDTKLDSAIYAADSGTFLTALPQDLVYTADIADMATTGDLTGKQDITGMTAYATVESLTAKQDAGDYLSASDSANFLLTSDSGNFYPMNENPSGYLTAHQSLADYQLTADMTGYLTTADSANFLTAVPAGTMNESAFEYDVNDKISGYNGSAFAGGSEVPEGVMVESGLEYNAVNEISAYNGSAIAQYGAEKQWLVHDDTLVHAANSAQYALGCNISALQRLMGIDETVLYSGNSTGGVELSEDPTNFNYLRIDYGAKNSGANANVLSINVPAGITNYGFSHLFKSQPNSTATGDVYKSYSYYSGCNTTTWVKVYGTISQTPFTTITNNAGWTYIYKVIGIGRKS